MAFKVWTLSAMSLATLVLWASPGAPQTMGRSDIVNVDEGASDFGSANPNGGYSQSPASKGADLSGAREESATNPKPDTPGIHADANEAFNRGADFDVVSIINKAACPAQAGQLVEGRCQSMTVYRFKTQNGRRFLGEKRTFPVSTGMERWVCEPKKDDATGAVLGYEARWTGTPTGYYNPYLLDADHKSKQYDDANMNYSVFFNKLGIATHQASNLAFERNLGHRASHGCVRMSRADSETVFRWVMQAGGPVDPTASRWQGDCVAADRVHTIPCSSFVASVRDEGWANGYGPYDPSPEVKDLNRNGTEKAYDPTKPVKTGYRALYIVQCVDAQGGDCSTRQIPSKPDCSQETANQDSGNVVRHGQAQPQGMPNPLGVITAPIGGLFNAIFNQPQRSNSY